MDHLTRLLVDARDGNHRALEQFIRETQSQVWRLCMYLGDRETAEDLAQESYERAISSLHRFRAEGSGLHWLLTIVRRTCADTTRRRTRQRRLHTAAIAQAQLRTGVHTDDDTGWEFDDLIARLDHDRRAAFALTQVLGLSYEEAASILQCPIGTIRSRVARARIDLIQMLNPTADAAHDLTQKRASS